MQHIIKSIKYTLTGLDKNPCIIYTGVGTFAGLKSLDENGISYLEDKNYHQFPPTLQKIFRENKDLHLCIILIDPMQESPIYMSTDNNLQKKLFNDNDWIHIQNNEIELYINERITVYPFRNSVKTEAYSRNNHNNNDYIDITNDLHELNQLCIEKDLTFIYHDFTGQDTSTYIENFFYESIKDHLDHIIYGFGNGFISGCYFDLTEPYGYIPTITEINEINERKVIKTFNIKHVLYNYKDVSEIISLNEYIHNTIDKYHPENISIIYAHIHQLKLDFETKFKNYIIHLLRIIKDYSDKLCNDVSDFDIDSYMEHYCLTQLSNENKLNIISMFKNKDIDIFNKTLYIIAKIYETEIKILLLNTQYENNNCYDIIKLIVQNPDKYQWYNDFNLIFNK